MRIQSDRDLLLFVSGDFCPAALPVSALPTQAEIPTVFGDLYEIIRDSDWAITNLECPLTLSGREIEKIGPPLKAHPDTARVLKSAGFDMVTLANNHIFDYGQTGLVDTLVSLQDKGMAYVGAGRDLNEARKTFFITLKGIRLAIINVAEIEFSCANAQHGGANAMDLIDNIHQIQEAHNKVDHILLIIHGGHEYYHYPSPETMRRYRFYAESGVSAIIAHHTHCIGGCELHRGVPIFYSLGNFLFPSPHKDRPACWYEGYAVLLRLGVGDVTYEILPYEQCNNRRLRIDTTRRNILLEKIHSISQTLNDDNATKVKWKAFVADRTDYYLTNTVGMGRFQARVLKKLGLLHCFYRRRQLNAIQQIIRCEAHKEAAGAILSDYLGYRGTL